MRAVNLTHSPATSIRPPAAPRGGSAHYGHNPLNPLPSEERRGIYREVPTERLFAAIDRLLDQYAAGAMDVRCVQVEFHDLSAEIEDRCREAGTQLLASVPGVSEEA